jgi:hypothetical protein
MVSDTQARDGPTARGRERLAIEIHDLIARYGRKKAVDGLSLRVPEGSVYGSWDPTARARRRLSGPFSASASLTAAPRPTSSCASGLCRPVAPGSAVAVQQESVLISYRL